MFRSVASVGVLTLILTHGVTSVPVSTMSASAASLVEVRDVQDWQSTLSADTPHRLEVARQHLDDKSAPGQAFRNDTIMRVNIEREALDVSLIDLSQAFGLTLPASRTEVAGAGVHKRNNAEDFREEAYLRGGTMTYPQRVEKRSNAEDVYSNLLNRKSLALGAVERVNIAHRIVGQPELTINQSQNAKSYDEYVSKYWSASMEHGRFWTTDQSVGKPNFIEGGQVNGLGFTQSTYHKLHCLANLRMILSWHINGKGANMTRDMSVHAIHCLEYIRGRELANPDLNEEPIDTVDYEGMGIH